MARPRGPLVAGSNLALGMPAPFSPPSGGRIAREKKETDEVRRATRLPRAALGRYAPSRVLTIEGPHDPAWRRPDLDRRARQVKEHIEGAGVVLGVVEHRTVSPPGLPRLTGAQPVLELLSVFDGGELVGVGAAELLSREDEAGV